MHYFLKDPDRRILKILKNTPNFDRNGFVIEDFYPR